MEDGEVGASPERKRGALLQARSCALSWILSGYVRPLARAKVSVCGIKVFMAPASQRRWWRQETLGRVSVVRTEWGAVGD